MVWNCCKMTPLLYYYHLSKSPPWYKCPKIRLTLPTDVAPEKVHWDMEVLQDFLNRDNICFLHNPHGTFLVWLHDFVNYTHATQWFFFCHVWGLFAIIHMSLIREGVVIMQNMVLGYHLYFVRHSDCRKFPCLRGFAVWSNDLYLSRPLWTN